MTPGTMQQQAASRAQVRPWIAGLATFVAVLTIDVALKDWALESLAVPVCLTTWMCLAVQYNSGLFLGTVTLTPDSMVTAVHWLMVTPVLAWLAWRVLTMDRVEFNACYALVAGGLVGNLVGRADGAVVDYLGVGPVIDEKWAFMNLADVALLGGVVWLGVLLVRRRQFGTRSNRRTVPSTS